MNVLVTKALCHNLPVCLTITFTKYLYIYVDLLSMYEYCGDTYRCHSVTTLKMFNGFFLSKTKNKNKGLYTEDFPIIPVATPICPDSSTHSRRRYLEYPNRSVHHKEEWRTWWLNYGVGRTHDRNDNVVTNVVFVSNHGHDHCTIIIKYSREFPALTDFPGRL